MLMPNDSFFHLYIYSFMDFFFVNELKYTYNISHIIGAIIATVGFFTWCTYRFKQYTKLPDSNKIYLEYLIMIIVFAIIRYSLPSETAFLFLLMVGTSLSLFLLLIILFLISDKELIEWE
jgi:hypothetical protein